MELQTFEEVKNQLKQIDVNLETRGKKYKYVLPGDVITADATYMRGHGTYYDDALEGCLDNNGEEVSHERVEKQLVSSLAGVVEPINRLISVRPLRTRYNGAIGDVVVGRIIEVQQKRWRVETNARLHSILLLSSVNLPGGELRKKTIEDELLMRKYLAEGDLICAEVQTTYEDGAMGLYTRSLKYGKLGQGLVIKVSPSMIAKRKMHTHNLPCGVYLILGNNGWIFLSTTAMASTNSGGYVIDHSQIEGHERQKISRVRNSILALADNKIMLDYHSIVAAYDLSEKLELDVRDLLKPTVARMLASSTRDFLQQSNMIQA